MSVSSGAGFSRRELIRTGAVIGAGLFAGPALAHGQMAAQVDDGIAAGVARATATPMPASPLTIRPDLFRRALAALQRHDGAVKQRDRIGLVDFDIMSAQPRFHIVNLESGQSKSMLVAHGRGSDPDHTGWLTLFSNVDGSAASSRGTYLTEDTYIGQHGLSRRMKGLDITNSNVESRAIVIHAAWYVGQDMIAQHGKLGRSEGCFAVSSSDLDYTLNALGPGRMIYADKV